MSGGKPIVIDGVKLRLCLKGLTIIEATAENSETNALTVVGVRNGGRIKSRYKFLSLLTNLDDGFRRYELQHKWEGFKKWVELQRERRVNPQLRVSRRQREITTLEKRLRNIRAFRPANPAITLPRDSNSDSNGWREVFRRWRAEKPKRIRAMQLARRVLKGEIDTRKFYQLATVGGFSFKKWSDMTSSYRERYHLIDVVDYLKRWWEFCYLMTDRPKLYGDGPDGLGYGPRRYQWYLESLWEKREIEAKITMLREADDAAKR